jgi:ankyrin repeat protein
MAYDWIHELDSEGESLLQRGLRCSYGPVVDLFLRWLNDEGTDHEVHGPRMHEAARNQDVAGVKSYIDAGDDMNAFDIYGLTPLHYAALHDLLDLAKLLINRGAHVNQRDYARTDLTPMALAKHMGREEVSAYLRQYGGLE